MADQLIGTLDNLSGPLFLATPADLSEYSQLQNDKRRFDLLQAIVLSPSLDRDFLGLVWHTSVTVAPIWGPPIVRASRYSSDNVEGIVYTCAPIEVRRNFTLEYYFFVDLKRKLVLKRPPDAPRYMESGDRFNFSVKLSLNYASM